MLCGLKRNFLLRQFFCVATAYVLVEKKQNPTICSRELFHFEHTDYRIGKILSENVTVLS